MDFIFLIAVLLISVVLHEVSHGAVANALGDSTAKDEGRLTLNPIPHLDPFGSVILPLLLLLVSGGGFAIGWAKPVPVNPMRLRDQKWGHAKVSIAGPASNLLIALVFGLLLRFLPLAALPSAVPYFLASIVSVNLLLALFNFLPIPPLDGSHLLFSVLPDSMRSMRAFLQQYGFFLLLIFIFFFFDWLVSLVRILFSLIVGFSL
ncbi:MAG: site-2 protease family protein [Parcubacteria group bacterium]|nr:site-2 protease family protein [Parcubacteria group bacterium]